MPNRFASKPTPRRVPWLYGIADSSHGYPDLIICARVETRTVLRQPTPCTEQVPWSLRDSDRNAHYMGTSLFLSLTEKIVQHIVRVIDVELRCVIRCIKAIPLAVVG